MVKSSSPILETTVEARSLAKKLIRTARHGALAVVEPKTGHPISTRVAVAQRMDGTPVILTSRLSAHTVALLEDSRCSLLVGEPGKGDPLAHPRITLIATAETVAKDSPDLELIRTRYLCRHPKAALYVDFPDFDFHLLKIERANLNGGFGKAFILSAEDLILKCTWLREFEGLENDVIEHMNRDHQDALNSYAAAFCGAGGGKWRMVSLDPEGLDLVNRDQIVRITFEKSLENPKEIRSKLVLLATEARRMIAESKGS